MLMQCPYSTGRGRAKEKVKRQTEEVQALDAHEVRDASGKAEQTKRDLERGVEER